MEQQQPPYTQWIQWIKKKTLFSHIITRPWRYTDTRNRERQLWCSTLNNLSKHFSHANESRTDGHTNSFSSFCPCYFPLVLLLLSLLVRRHLRHNYTTNKIIKKNDSFSERNFILICRYRKCCAAFSFSASNGGWFINELAHTTSPVAVLLVVLSSHLPPSPKCYDTRFIFSTKEEEKRC